MDRCFTNEEFTRIVDDSLEVHMNLLPYYCRENIDCWPAIKRGIKAVKKYSITPELYWHGNRDEFEWLLVLLSDGYPSPEELLKLAKGGTKGEIYNIVEHFYQYVSVMFNHVKTHHGYVVLSPTAYMQNLYPNSKDMLYVYTSEKWSHKERMHIDGAVLVLRADEIGSFRELLRKKLGII